MLSRSLIYSFYLILFPSLGLFLFIFVCEIFDFETVRSLTSHSLPRPHHPRVFVQPSHAPF